jgi:hypothetical protein
VSTCHAGRQAGRCPHRCRRCRRRHRHRFCGCGHCGRWNCHPEPSAACWVPQMLQTTDAHTGGDGLVMGGAQAMSFGQASPCSLPKPAYYRETHEAIPAETRGLPPASGDVRSSAATDGARAAPTAAHGPPMPPPMCCACTSSGTAMPGTLKLSASTPCAASARAPAGPSTTPAAAGVVACA